MIEILRNRRRELGLTQAQLGRKFGLSQNAISSIELGKGWSKTYARMLDALRLELVPEEELRALRAAARQAEVP